MIEKFSYVDGLFDFDSAKVRWSEKLIRTLVI